MKRLSQKYSDAMVMIDSSVYHTSRPHRKLFRHMALKGRKKAVAAGSTNGTGIPGSPQERP
jgi:hypothetical protein